MHPAERKLSPVIEFLAVNMFLCSAQVSQLCTPPSHAAWCVSGMWASFCLARTLPAIFECLLHAAREGCSAVIR